jgi:hypothetical protein
MKGLPRDELHHSADQNKNHFLLKCRNNYNRYLFLHLLKAMDNILLLLFSHQELQSPGYCRIFIIEALLPEQFHKLT